MNLILLGGPGAGKGSLARCITDDYGIIHISSGEIFRDHITNETDLGKRAKIYSDNGDLVPDDLTIEVILRRLKEPDCENGFILDGYPRTLPQAKAFAAMMRIDAVIHVIVSEETVVARLSSRYICKACKEIHNKRWHDISECRTCHAELYQRDDDKEATVRKRYREYIETETQLLEFYKTHAGATNVLSTESLLSYSPKDLYRHFLDKHVRMLNYIATHAKSKDDDAKK